MAGQQPAYRAFTVIKREGEDDFWLPTMSERGKPCGKATTADTAALADPPLDVL
jgi:hypothetical protein